MTAEEPLNFKALMVLLAVKARVAIDVEALTVSVAPAELIFVALVAL